jgi:hypothetical protein
VLQKIALSLVALSLGLPVVADAAKVRPRHSCTSPEVRKALSAGTLTASFHSPSGIGAALMASDIYYAATKRFPRALPKRWVAYAHGTNRAGDRSAVYPCAILNRFIETPTARRKTTALCINYRGDSFMYTFVMA